MARIVDEGKVSLDAPIERYLPGVVDGNGFDGNTITVRRLLQHTSGIKESQNPTSQNADGTFDLAAVVRDGPSYPPVSAPGAARATASACRPSRCAAAALPGATAAGSPATPR